MSEFVWASGAYTDPAIAMPMLNDIEPDKDAGVSGSLEFRGSFLKNRDGVSLAAEYFPRKIWGRKNFRPTRKLPHFFQAFGYFVVSASCAEVIQSFDLGQGALYPVSAFLNDQVTPIDGKWFCINFGNVKNAFVPEQSRGFYELTYKGVVSRSFDIRMNDDDASVSKEAIFGPDIWCDPGLRGTFFISDKLAKALKTAKMDSCYSLTRCRVVV